MMSLDQNLFTEYQKQLIYAALEEFSGVFILPRYLGGQSAEKNQDWRQACVDFLYRNLKAGLIEVSPIHIEFLKITPITLTELFAKFSPDENGGSFWSYIDFRGTPKLREMLISNNLFDWQFFHSPVNQDFLADLEKLYLENGVGFSEKIQTPTVR